MGKRLTIGDVYEIATPTGLAYVQYTHDDPDKSELVRVLPGLYATRPNIKELTQQKELYFVFYLIGHALRRGHVKLVSNEPIPEWAKAFPVMRHEGILDKSWYIGDGSMHFSLENIPKFLKVKDLTPEQRKLSISSSIYPHPAMVKELARGWTPERDEEFDRMDVVEAKAREEAQAKQKGNGKRLAESKFLDHYFYFPKKSNAEKAAERLRAKGWIVEVRKGSDSENWLTLAKQPAPIEDDIGDIRDELERLAEELGGEYDGWGAAV